MNASRHYQVLADRAVCLHPGCAWRVDGPAAEATAEAHAIGTGHQAQVTTAATVTFGSMQVAVR